MNEVRPGEEGWKLKSIDRGFSPFCFPGPYPGYTHPNYALQRAGFGVQETGESNLNLLDQIEKRANLGNAPHRRSLDEVYSDNYEPYGVVARRDHNMNVVNNVHPNVKGDVTMIVNGSPEVERGDDSAEDDVPKAAAAAEGSAKKPSGWQEDSTLVVSITHSPPKWTSWKK